MQGKNICASKMKLIYDKNLWHTLSSELNNYDNLLNELRFGMRKIKTKKHNVTLPLTLSKN